MDSDDPEKRIAELERQLAEAQAAAQQNPATGQGPQTFFAPGMDVRVISSQTASLTPDQARRLHDVVSRLGMSAADWQTYAQGGASGMAPFRGEFRAGPPGAMPPPPVNWQQPGRLPAGYLAATGGRTLRRAVLWSLFALVVLAGPLIGLAGFLAHHASSHGSGSSAVTTWTTPAPPPPPNACDLLTPDIVQPFLGSDAKISQNTQPNPQETLCVLTGSNGILDVAVGRWSMIKPIWSDLRPVPGLGDQASLSDMGLYVKKGPLGFKVHATGRTAGQSEEDEAEKAIAQQLLPKL
jgi:hypothetical protein